MQGARTTRTTRSEVNSNSRQDPLRPSGLAADERLYLSGATDEQLRAFYMLKEILGEVAGPSGIMLAPPWKREDGPVPSPLRVTMYLSSEVAGLAPGEIGSFFNRDCGVVRSAIAAVKKRITADPETRARIERLTSKLRKDLPEMVRSQFEYLHRNIGRAHDELTSSEVKAFCV